MEQTFIRVGVSGDRYDKDIKDATKDELFKWSLDQSTGQLLKVIEKLLGFKEEN